MPEAAPQAEAQRLASTTETCTPIEARAPVGSVEARTGRSPFACNPPVRQLAALLPGSSGGEAHLDGPCHVDERRRVQMLRKIPPEAVDLAVPFGLRGRIGVAPDANVVVTARMGAVLQQLVRAVALRANERLQLPGKSEEIALLSVRNFQRDN